MKFFSEKFLAGIEFCKIGPWLAMPAMVEASIFSRSLMRLMLFGCTEAETLAWGRFYETFSAQIYEQNFKSVN
jgi:hypothetical protein